MKKLIALLLLVGGSSLALADIHDPPANDYGPTRKLGRGISNFFLAPTEVTTTIAKINTDEGNSAAYGYGVVRAVGRTASRGVVGFLEAVTWPFPTWHDSYKPMLPSNVHYIHAGYSEFPPELGWESKYKYVRDY